NHKWNGIGKCPRSARVLNLEVNVPGDCTSVRFSTVAHEVTLEQLVPRATPLTRIMDAELPLPATKFTPRTASGKASTSPVMVLDGRIASIAGPLEIEMVADADFVGSASLVAITEIAFGEGAALGAV